jgi:hypothetical protein
MPQQWPRHVSRNMPVIEDHLGGLAASRAHQRGDEAYQSNTEQII